MFPLAPPGTRRLRSMAIALTGLPARFAPQRRPRLARAFALALALARSGNLAHPAAPDVAARARMLEDIAAMAGATAAETGRAAISANVMAAMSRVPRPRFVSPPLAASAWDNRPLPIGEGQTISQPFIVALMTDLLELRAGDSVLEFGTGSGYQAALLAELVANVYTIEIVAPLGRKAAATLAALGYRNINTRIGDGYAGWREYAPYDAIMVTAAAPEVPAALIEQLRPGGRLVIPVSGSAEVQALLLLHKQADGRTLSRRVLPVRFVPLVRGAPAK